MKVLVLWARTGVTNLGVQALADGARALALRAFPNADVRTHGTGGPDLAGNDGPVNLMRHRRVIKEAMTPRSSLRRWLSTFDLVLDTRAGDSFTDIYGLEQLAKMSLVGEVAHQLGVPVVLAPQTHGPFRSSRSKALARRSLRTATLVMTRDTRSAQVARDLGVEPDVIATDVAFALDVPTDVEKSRDVLLNVSGLLWSPNPHVDHNRYRQSMLELIEDLARAERRVSLLGHVVHQDESAGDNDTHAMSEVSRRLGDSLEVIKPRDLADARRYIASAEAVIGARMHACLNAISMGVPAVPLAYSDKFEPLMSDLGLADVTVDLRTSRGVASEALAVLGLADLTAATAGARALATDRLALAVDALRGVV